MRILSLYIDKWYIVGTIMDGANRTPLSLSNAEDRIWLYFYSNSTTNAVKYSLSYKDEALAGENGYYADVFELLPDYKEYHYEKYGARKNMSEIFPMQKFSLTLENHTVTILIIYRCMFLFPKTLIW